MRFLGTPGRGIRQSDTAHSGLLPYWALRKQTLYDFAGVEPDMKPILAPPLPGRTIDRVMQAILDDVSEIISNSVSRATLRAFQALWSEEMRTCARAGTEPLHVAAASPTNGFACLSSRFSEGEAQFESRLANVEESPLSVAAALVPTIWVRRDVFKGARIRCRIAKCPVSIQVGAFPQRILRLHRPWYARPPGQPEVDRRGFHPFPFQDRARPSHAVQRWLQARNGLASAKDSTLAVNNSNAAFRRARDWAVWKSDDLIKNKVGNAATVEHKPPT